MDANHIELTKVRKDREVLESIFQAPLHRLQLRVMLIQQELWNMGIRYYQRFLVETNPDYAKVGALKDVYQVMNFRTTDQEVMERVVNDLEDMIQKLKSE